MTNEGLKELLTNFIPNLNMEVGLFSVMDVATDEAVAWPGGTNIILETPYEHNIYSDLKEPQDSDYYLCSRCGERHLRECFDEGPDIIRVQKRVRYFVEMPQVDGYKRLVVPPEGWVQDKWRLEAARHDFKNQGETPWQVDGWFISCEKGLVGFEIIPHGPFIVPKDGMVSLTPVLSLGRE
jgi:hypothetical protein